MSYINQEFPGSVSVNRNITIGGGVTARENSTFSKDVIIEGSIIARNIRGACKGLFLSETTLNTSFPDPQQGWFAYVFVDKVPTEYVAEGGVWKTTGRTGINIQLDVDTITTMQGDIETIEKAINNGTTDPTTYTIIYTSTGAKLTYKINSPAGISTGEIAFNVATSQNAGIMSAADKTNIDLLKNIVIDELQQQSGTAENKLMSQKAITDADNAISSRITSLYDQVNPLTVSVIASPVLLDRGQKTMGTVTMKWETLKAGNQVVCESWDILVNGNVETSLSQAGSNGTSTIDLNSFTELGFVKIGLKATKGGEQVTNTVNIRLTVPYYYGFSAKTDPKSTIASDADMTNKGLMDKPAGSYTLMNHTAGQYLWLIVPSDKTIQSVTSSGFYVPMQSLSNIDMYGNSCGTWKCYRSASGIQQGMMNIVIS